MCIVYMYACACMHVVCTCRYVSAYTCVHLHFFLMCMCVYVCVYVCLHVDVWMCVCMCVCDLALIGHLDCIPHACAGISAIIRVHHCVRYCLNVIMHQVLAIINVSVRYSPIR